MLCPSSSEYIDGRFLPYRAIGGCEALARRWTWIANAGYGTSQCISTLKKLLGANTLRRGDGVIALPESRQRERLLRVGRTKLAAKWVKMEVHERDYNPRSDTCVRAFVRLLAAQNT